MDGPRYNTVFPAITYAQVIEYDPQNHQVYVALPSMQRISVPAKILFWGTADATRVDQNPLPVIGTMGVVAIPHGDTKSVIWLGAIYPTSTNAVTTSEPIEQTDSQIDYHSHASGDWSLLDYVGNFTRVLADQSVINANFTNTKPTVYRHTVDENGYPLTVEVKDPRNPTPPGPFYLSVNHPSGASITITPSGTVTAKSGNPQNAFLTLTPQGIVQLSTGNTNQTNPHAAQFNHQIELNPQATGGALPLNITTDSQTGSQSTVSIDQSGNIQVATLAGNINIDSSTGSVSIVAMATINLTAMGMINLTAVGPINITTAADVFLTTGLYGAPLSINDIVTKYNAHVHSGVTTGSGDTGAPTTDLP